MDLFLDSMLVFLTAISTSVSFMKVLCSEAAWFSAAVVSDSKRAKSDWMTLNVEVKYVSWRSSESIRQGLGNMRDVVICVEYGGECVSGMGVECEVECVSDTHDKQNYSILIHGILIHDIEPLWVSL
jgi:hypothetical protein